MEILLNDWNQSDFVPFYLLKIIIYNHGNMLVIIEALKELKEINAYPKIKDLGCGCSQGQTQKC